MLDEKRIKEAEENVPGYLRDGFLKRSSFDANIFNVYFKNSSDSLDVADMLMKARTSNLWIVVTSYYSMFYISNALLYKIGYKVGDKIAHKITADALVAFARKKIKLSFIDDFLESKEEAMEIAATQADEIIADFDAERIKRAKFQYKMPEEAKERHARTSFERAKKFCFEFEKVVNNI